MKQVYVEWPVDNDPYGTLVDFVKIGIRELTEVLFKSRSEKLWKKSNIDDMNL